MWILEVTGTSGNERLFFQAKDSMGSETAVARKRVIREISKKQLDKEHTQKCST